MNLIGPRIKEARALASPPLTQESLAAKLQLEDWDIDRSGVAKIENGFRQVTDIELVKLARALGVSPAWLLEGY